MAMKKMRDNELENIAGGFRETGNVPTQGMNIVCPKCKSGDNIRGGALFDNKMGSVEYSCGCGTDFVCYDGQVILKSKWIKLCNAKKYHYPFA